MGNYLALLLLHSGKRSCYFGKKKPQNQKNKQPVQNKKLVSLEKSVPFSNSRCDDIFINEPWAEDVLCQFNHH